MSHNQSRAERSDSTQYKRTGRSGGSNQQHQFQGSASSKGGGGAPFNTPSRGCNKKYNSNAAQGGQSRVRIPNGDPDSAGHAVHNGPQEQQPTHRLSDAPASSTSSNAKRTDAATHRTTQAVPRSPYSNVSTAASTSKVSAANPEYGFPKTPAKGDASGSFALQFGSITPGFMNGVQIPPTTSSAPPNLDEQKGDQARQNLSRAAAPPVPLPMPKQQQGHVGFQPGQVGNYGVLRKPRAPTPIQYAGGIILSGPMQSLSPQGVLLRNNSDSDRWQREIAFHEGLLPPPQTPPPVMHIAEKKYEVGKVIDEEYAKQRQLNAILNKLMPRNFEKSLKQVKQVNIDNVVTVSGLISQIFDKVLTEPTFCEMYADFCFHLATDLPELSVDNEKITFKRLLLNKCQEEFERGEREEQEANEAEEGESKQTEEEREEKRLRVRRRMLGNIRLIGELYKKKMFTERIMHECIKKLLGQDQNPDEENIEALCKLMSTIGEMIDHPKSKDHMDYYFDIMTQLSNNMKLSSRVRFMLRDAIDLRKNKWQQRRKVEGPKKIEEVYRDEKKYEVHKVIDEIYAKLRQLNVILNKLTPRNFEKLLKQVKQVNIDNVVTLSGLISQIFDKALTEQPIFCEMYADFCFHLAIDLPELSVDNEKITFKRLLVNKCQEEFERGEREEQEANEAEEGESKQTEEEREEKRLRVRRRTLGNIRLIGELYKKKMLTERIMHECINKLLGQYQNPDEENIEALCILMSIIGEMIDHPKAKEHVDAYFDIMTQLSNNMKLSSRVRIMLRDVIDLRKNEWQQRRKVYYSL